MYRRKVTYVNVYIIYIYTYVYIYMYTYTCLRIYTCTWFFKVEFLTSNLRSLDPKKGYTSTASKGLLIEEPGFLDV